MNMIMNKTAERTGAAPSNFRQHFMAPAPELAHQVAKDHYNFEFLPYRTVPSRCHGTETGKFQPEYAGKLNSYVALVDDVLHRAHVSETIGILICGTKNDRSVRYSLRRSTSPMAVAAYTYDKLPPAEQKPLPNEGHLVAALGWIESDSEVMESGE